MNTPYDDIIHLPHPTSQKHPRMPLADRAAQFSPFAALTGHGAAIKETARLTDQRMELTEEAKAELDNKLRLIAEHLPERPEVTVTYFVADERKAGGTYMEVTGTMKKLDVLARAVVLTDGRHIPTDDIYDMDSALLRPLL